MLATTTWQIVQVCMPRPWSTPVPGTRLNNTVFKQLSETDLPGEFKMWAVVGGVMRNFMLTLPRVFYVNCRGEDATAVCALVCFAQHTWGCPFLTRFATAPFAVALATRQQAPAPVASMSVPIRVSHG